MAEKFDDLTAFMHWWLSTRTLCPPVDDPTNGDDKYQGAVLYRSGPYQVELFTIKPNTVGVAHVHPNVDSYELYVSGDIDFTIDGKLYSCTDQIVKPVPVRIYPHYWHEGVTSATGGSFLSIQKWLNGVPPSSVTLDWADNVGNDRVAWVE